MASDWRSSPRWWRVTMMLALVWGVFRLALQVYLFVSPMSDQVGVDVREAYLVAGRRFLEQGDLYPTTMETMEGTYFYTPSLAMFFALLTPFSETVGMFSWFVLCLAAYIALFLTWQRIFIFLGLEKARRALWFSLPLWVVFSPFWDDATYLNIYTLMALLGSLLLEAVLRERLLLASLYLMVILAAKPQWAFVLVLPLLLGRARFFWKLLGGAFVAYLGLAAGAMVFSSPSYILEQYRDYFRFLTHLTQIHPWRTAATDGFLGYNHSIVQVAVFLGGEKARLAGQVIKYLLLLVGGVLVLQYSWRYRRYARGYHKEEPLILAFVLYLLAFLWLDLLWELFWAIAIYPFLLSLDLRRIERILAGAVFLPYALLDVWRIAVYASGSPLIQDAYLAWDFSAYLPLILFVGVTCYFLLARRLWAWRQVSLVAEEREIHG